MTNDEAATLQPGDLITVNALHTKVEGITHHAGDVFVQTSYGDFNASVCEIRWRQEAGNDTQEGS